MSLSTTSAQENSAEQGEAHEKKKKEDEDSVGCGGRGSWREENGDVSQCLASRCRR